MAVRFQSAIENAISVVNNGMQQKVKNAQEEAQRLLDKIMEHKQDMIDVIDTWKYIKEKKVDKYFNKGLVYPSYVSSRKTKTIGVGDSFIGMQFNDWKKEGGGPYNWFVFFNGEDVFININNDESAKVKDMIAKAVYNKSDDIVILPIYDKNHRYTCHDCSKPLNALNFFANRIDRFCNEFFNDAQNITLK